jgi:hypothetical protein
MYQLVLATCENCKYGTMKTLHKNVHCRIYHKQYETKHYCQRHKLRKESPK